MVDKQVLLYNWDSMYRVIKASSDRIVREIEMRMEEEGFPPASKNPQKQNVLEH